MIIIIITMIITIITGRLRANCHSLVVYWPMPSMQIHGFLRCVVTCLFVSSLGCGSYACVFAPLSCLHNMSLPA